MLGCVAVWAAICISMGPEDWDFDPSDVRPVARSSWRAVRSSGAPEGSDNQQVASPRRMKVEDSAGVRASYDEPAADDDGFASAPGPAPADRIWSPEIADAFNRLEVAQRAAMAGQPVENWRFETVRAGYERMLKEHQDDAILRGEIRRRLGELARLERAAAAARKAEAILNKSHRRDEQLARIRRNLDDQERAQAASYKAVGMIQPSSKRVDGRKLYVLIANNGARRAYLDVPPGIDADSLIAHRVGIRGSVNYDDELGSRLITVRDIEEIKNRE